MKLKNMYDSIEHVKCFLLKIRKVQGDRHKYLVIIKHV
jgi:hypothetical protein